MFKWGLLTITGVLACLQCSLWPPPPHPTKLPLALTWQIVNFHVCPALQRNQEQQFLYPEINFTSSKVRDYGLSSGTLEGGGNEEDSDDDDKAVCLGWGASEAFSGITWKM